MSKKSLLKSFLTTASILGISSILPICEVYAGSISTMTGDASLSNTRTNWNPEFVSGNTIVVQNPGGFNLTADDNVTIQAVRLDAPLRLWDSGEYILV